MKNMKIFEPAMCCETGLCGVGVDPELLRISTVLNTLKNKGVTVSRYNLSNAPMEFINNKGINAYINAHGPESLPIITLDDKIIITGRYPTNEEFISLLGLPKGMLKVTQKKSGGCGCKGGCC
ncbi:MAG: arsenite efflux transporter metallochaperone ArsD [Lachnospiraceae bacterium]|nr:arsenite efflux transporter metallochaperone ArsD [Lachnospiraceae bacterium]